MVAIEKFVQKRYVFDYVDDASKANTDPKIDVM